MTRVVAILVCFVVANSFATTPDQNLKQKRIEMTSLCRREMHEGLSEVNKKFAAEKESLLKANLPINDYKKKSRELDHRILDATRPVYDQQQKCFMKIP